MRLLSIQKGEQVFPILPLDRYKTIDYQAGLIASTGQADAQAPQSMHVSGSITYMPSPADIADTGHSPSHEPQAIHASEIT